MGIVFSSIPSEQKSGEDLLPAVAPKANSMACPAQPFTYFLYFPLPTSLIAYYPYIKTINSYSIYTFTNEIPLFSAFFLYLPLFLYIPLFDTL